MYAFVGIFLLCLSFWLMTVNGLYDEFCEEKKAFDPYLKIYGGRSKSSDINDWGIQLNEGDEGPDPVARYTRELKDIFVCLNGPAWLYYEWKTDKKVGRVYDDANFAVYEHKCQLFNGAPGPGNTTERKTLVAILLLGKNLDYRNPYLQLFTAPLYDEATEKYKNVTSFMTIGTETCVISKGGTNLHIRPTPVEASFDRNMYCKLSFTNISIIESGITDDVKKNIEKFLINDVTLKNEQCGENKHLSSRARYELTNPDVDPKIFIGEMKGTFSTTVEELQNSLKELQSKDPLKGIIDKGPIDTTTEEKAVTDAEEALKIATDAEKKVKNDELGAARAALCKKKFEKDIQLLNEETKEVIYNDATKDGLQKDLDDIFKESGCDDNPKTGLCSKVEDYKTALGKLREKEELVKDKAKNLKDSYRPTKELMKILADAKKDAKDAKPGVDKALSDLNTEIKAFQTKISEYIYKVDKGAALLKALIFSLKRLKETNGKPQKECDVHFTLPLTVEIKGPKGRSFPGPRRGGPAPNPGGPAPNPGGPAPNPGGPAPNPGGPAPNPGGPAPNPGGPAPNPGGPAPNPGGRQAREIKETMKTTPVIAKDRKAALRRRFARNLDRATSINPDAVSRRSKNNQRVVRQTPPAEVRNCEAFKTPQEICWDKKPGVVRACHLLKAIQGRPEKCAVSETEKTEADNIPKMADLMDNTTTVILDLIKDVFSTACTPIKKADEFARRINDITKCYFVKPKTDGGAEIKINKEEPSTEENSKKARSDKKFWSHVLEALTICRDKKMTLNFTEKPFGSGNFVFQKGDGKGGWTEEPVHHFIEQADREYVFNFVLEMHFRMFATVMGLCMPSYEQKIPLITTTFYTMYTDAYFKPLIKTWIDSNDNQVFKFILGNYINGKTQFWATECMEASFIQSGDVSYRPPRDLYVNGGSEKNFFISGIYKHTTGRYNLKPDCK